MSSRKTKGPAAKPRLHHDGSGKSQDRKRDREEQKHHPEVSGAPHEAHKVRRHPVGDKPHHQPHTRPEEFQLNIDHGTHQDRPRPGSLAKKSRHP